MLSTILRRSLAVIAATLTLAGCGGDDSDSDSSTVAPPTAPPAGSPSVPSAPATTTPGVWKGTITSTITNEVASLIGLTGHDGHSVWMTTDGRVWNGQVPLHGDHFDATFAGHMSDGARFPDGTTHGPASMSFERHTATVMTGRHSGSDDAGAFNMTPSPTWDRPVALSFDSLLDADAMRDWMATMHPLEHGGHSHGGPMTGGGHHMGQNTVPSGQRNLFMFALVSGHGAIVDALAR